MIRMSDTLPSRTSRRQARWAVQIDMSSRDPSRITVLQQEFTVSYKPGDIQALNKRFVTLLETIRRDLRGSTTSLSQDKYDKCLNKLRDIGADAYALLPDGMTEYIQELEEELEADEPGRGISLDFTFPPEMALLWEMVYSGDPFGAVDIQQFWGIRYPIGHLFWNTHLRPSIKLRQGVFASIHEQLHHTHSELAKIEEKLRQIREHLQLDVSLQRLEHALFEDDLNEETLLRYFYSHDFTYGIVHFACHCVNPTDTSASQAYLRITADRCQVDLRSGYFKKLAKHKHRFRHRPLVFLNACQSSTPLYLLQSLNFPRNLLTFRAGGVIATACTMPDHFASQFAVYFYHHLLEHAAQRRPAFISEALWQTRRHFLAKDNNPLGLAYGLYAVSSQELRLGD